jgi:hypothetical protein
MSKKSIAVLILLIISPIVIYLLWPTEEGRIRKLIKNGAKAVEAKKVDDVMSKISYTYTDQYAINYLVIKEALQREFQRINTISIEYDITEVEVKKKGEEKTASAKVDVRVIITAGKEAGYVVGDAAKPAHLRLSLEKGPTGWLINSVEGIKLDF